MSTIDPTRPGAIIGYRKSGCPIRLIGGGAPTIAEERATAVKAAQDIIAKAKTEGRDLTDDDVAALETHKKSVEDLDARAERQKAHDGFTAMFGAPADASTDDDDPAGSSLHDAKTLGEHFVKTVGERFIAAKDVSGAVVSAPEWTPGGAKAGRGDRGAKAASDPQTTTSSTYGPVLTEVDRTIVRGVRPPLTIEDLCGSGTMSGNAVTYFVEGGLEGGFSTVAEGAAKPQMHFIDPTTVTDGLKKIAGWFDLTDEMYEDLDFMVSEINERGLFLLGQANEGQILSGNGTGTNILGIMNRSGVQLEARGTTASGDTAADAIFRGMTKVYTGGGLNPDAIAIHPLDYQTQRLAKDGNGQYYGGGFFTGEYGVGGFPAQPPLWGLKTVVTPAIPQGTALVGAFKQAATVYSKGGVRVETTNSHGTNFTSNKRTVRIENRKALAVRRPAAFVKVTLTPAA